jgi:hypothetical protein
MMDKIVVSVDIVSRRQNTAGRDQETSPAVTRKIRILLENIQLADRSKRKAKHILNGLSIVLIDDLLWGGTINLG